MKYVLAVFFNKPRNERYFNYMSDRNVQYFFGKRFPLDKIGFETVNKYVEKEKNPYQLFWRPRFTKRWMIEKIFIFFHFYLDSSKKCVIFVVKSKIDIWNTQSYNLTVTIQMWWKAENSLYPGTSSTSIQSLTSVSTRKYMKVRCLKCLISQWFLNQSLRNSISSNLLIFMDIHSLSLMWLSLMVPTTIVTPMVG